MNSQELYGQFVYEELGHKKRGKIIQIVGHPHELRVVGVLVKQPDLLWMFPRKDIFIALDALEQDDCIRIKAGSDAVGTKALKARSLDWNACILYLGLALQDTQGKSCGTLQELSFDRKTGLIQSIVPSSKILDRLLLGKKTIDAASIQGVRVTEDPALIVDLETFAPQEEEGLAAAAGAVYYGKLKPHVQATVQKVSSTSQEQDARAEQFDATVQDLAFKTGTQIAKTKGMFSAFKEEFDKARK